VKRDSIFAPLKETLGGGSEPLNPPPTFQRTVVLLSVTPIALWDAQRLETLKKEEGAKRPLPLFDYLDSLHSPSSSLIFGSMASAHMP
jgi:hypothetical protein